MPSWQRYAAFVIPQINERFPPLQDVETCNDGLKMGMVARPVAERAAEAMGLSRPTARYVSSTRCVPERR